MQWNPIDVILKYLHFMQGQYSPFHLRSYTVEIVKHCCHYEFMTKSKENKHRPKDPKQKSYVRHRKSYCPWCLKDKPLSKGHIYTTFSVKKNKKKWSHILQLSSGARIWVGGGNLYILHALTHIMWIHNIWDQFEKLKVIHLNSKWYLM